MEKLATQMRLYIRDMVARAGGGHAGGSLSVTDILAALYGGVMTHDPSNPASPERDRLILSKGHSGLALYAALAATGYIPAQTLESFGLAGGTLMNHPDRHVIPGVEVSTGSLGHGLPLACGLALAAQLKGEAHTVFCVLGDAECAEGSVWEAALFAGARPLRRLVAVIDTNGLGNDGALADSVPLACPTDKWKAFGFTTIEVDGHDTAALAGVLNHCKGKGDGPYAVIAHTTKGKGLVEGLAGTGACHYIKGGREELEAHFLPEGRRA